MPTNSLTAAMTTSFLSLNVAAIIVRTLVRRGIITSEDAFAMLSEIAGETLADAETPQEQQIADSFAAWLRRDAETNYTTQDQEA